MPPDRDLLLWLCAVGWNHQKDESRKIEAGHRFSFVLFVSFVAKFVAKFVAIKKQVATKRTKSIKNRKGKSSALHRAEIGREKMTDKLMTDMHRPSRW